MLQNFRLKAVSIAYGAKRPRRRQQGELGEELLKRKRRKQTEDKRKTNKEKREIKDMQKHNQGIVLNKSSKKCH